MALSPGTKLGPYEILAPLGAGGMGEVYRARDTRLDRTVAIKVLPPEFSKDPLRKQRFEREAKTISSLNHPHICVLYDVGHQQGIDFLVMECLEGETLADRLGTGPLPLEQVLEIGAQMADALDLAHRSGVVHRDLKPGNIMLTPSGAKLLDFGLAKTGAPLGGEATLSAAETPAKAATREGAIVGTFHYMSPEQVEGKDVDLRSDIFSLGAVLYEMLTGRRAFEGKSQLSVASAILEKEPSPIVQLKPDLPAALDRIVGKALEKDRDVRYQSAADLRADLKRTKRDIDSARALPKQPAQQSQPRARKGIDSLAVLPLVNTSGDPDAEYLSEGIAESLISGFSQLPKLRLAQRQKSFRYRGADLDLQQAARELNVQAVLTGRVLLRGDTLVVKMDLVDAERDAQVWAQQYTRKLSDILALQDEIAEEVIQALKLKLAAEPKKRPPRQTRDTGAYHLYLKGSYYWAKRTPDNTKKALELYQQAIERDPNYALAYAGMADCYAQLGFTPYGNMPPKEAFPRAKAAAQKALALDASLGEAHASLGLCAFFYDWDWAAAERAFRRSIELAPDSLGARIWYPSLLAATGRFEDALREGRRLIEIDPLSANAATAFGQALYFSRQFDEAARVLTQCLEINPNFHTTLVFVGLVHLAKGEFAEAARYAEKASSAFDHPYWLGTKGGFHGFAGRKDEARQVLDQLKDLAHRSYVSPYCFVWVYHGLGDLESLRSAMQASLEEKSGLMVMLNAAYNDNIRREPFFQEIIRKVGLPPAVGAGRSSGTPE